MQEILFYTFSTLALVFSAFVILARNPIYAGLSLIVSLFFVSGIFVMLHAPFIGVIQILIYTGAIMVLFLYVMMLLHIKHKRIDRLHKKLLFWSYIFIVPIAFFMFRDLVYVPSFSAIPVDQNFGSIFDVGQVLLGPFVLVFEIASLILLAAIIAVVTLTQKHQPEEKS